MPQLIDPKDREAYIKSRLEELNRVFSYTSIGDFSHDVPIPQIEDEFAPIFVGVQVMLEVIREKLAEVKSDRDIIEQEALRLQTLIDSLPVGVTIFEAPSGKPLYFNQRAVELLGRTLDTSKDSSTYSNDYQLVTQEGTQYPNQELPVSLTLTHKKPFHKRDVIVKHGPNISINLKISSVPVFNQNQQLNSIIAVYDDISLEKTLEELKSQFVSIASHQLRTPLGSMRWNLEMLLDSMHGNLNQKIKPVINDIYQSNLRLIHLVNDLLDITRLEEGRTPDQISTFNLNQFLETCLRQVRPIAQKKSVTLNLQPDPNNPSITLDSIKLENILLNLLSNAIIYNHPNGRVDLNALYKNTTLTITVADTGIGISNKDQKKIFKKFYRTNEAAKWSEQGTGLGLYVVKSYLDTWQGTIDVTSPTNKKENTGTLFTITIPISHNNSHDQK